METIILSFVLLNAFTWIISLVILVPEGAWYIISNI